MVSLAFPDIAKRHIGMNLGEERNDKIRYRLIFSGLPMKFLLNFQSHTHVPP